MGVFALIFLDAALVRTRGKETREWFEGRKVLLLWNGYGFR